MPTVREMSHTTTSAALPASPATSSRRFSGLRYISADHAACRQLVTAKQTPNSQ